MTTSKVRKQDRAITFLTQEEVQNLFSAIKTKRDRAIFAVAYRHGLRASEVGILQLTELDLKAGEDVYFAKDWLGHKNIQNTTIYSRFSTGTRDARARKMFSSNRVV